MLFAVLGLAVMAQNPLKKGTAQLNFGFGFSNYGLPVYLGFDYGVHPDVSLGAELSYRHFDESWNKGNYNRTVLGIAGNVNYHFNRIMHIPSNWDLYAGLNVGFYSWNKLDGYGGSHTSGLGLGAQLGGRYFFSRWGINLEVGGSNAFSGGKIGLTYKL